MDFGSTFSRIRGSGPFQCNRSNYFVVRLTLFSEIYLIIQKFGLILECPLYLLNLLFFLEVELLLPVLLLELVEVALFLEDLDPLLLDLLLELRLLLLRGSNFPDSKSISSEKKAGSKFFLLSLFWTALVNLWSLINSVSFLTHFRPLIINIS